MASFASLLSSIGVQTHTPQDSSKISPRISQAKPATKAVPAQPSTTSHSAPTGAKRKVDDDASSISQKVRRLEVTSSTAQSTATASGGRFQLSAKSTGSKPPAPISKPISKPAQISSPAKPLSRPASKISSAPPSMNATASSSSSTAVPKRGFASLMEKAKEAQAAAKSVATSGIKHKAAHKLSMRERVRLAEEQKAQAKAAKRGQSATQPQNRSRSPINAKPSAPAKGVQLNYKGTMKKTSQPLGYKGTMRKDMPGDSSGGVKKKSEPLGKYGGYASWSDLDEAEDGEDDWGSDASSDMEGGFDDVEKEEARALQAARKEDKEALAEEERHQRDKMERKRKLQQLSRNAAAKKRY